MVWLYDVGRVRGSNVEELVIGRPQCCLSQWWCVRYLS